MQWCVDDFELIGLGDDWPSGSPFIKMIYRKVSNIRRTKSQNLSASRLIL